MIRENSDKDGAPSLPYLLKISTKTKIN